jgi:hypothetical protein
MNSPTEPASLREQLQAIKWAQIHFKQDSIPSVHSGPLTDKTIDELLALFTTELEKLKEQKQTYVTELAWKHAASVEAIPLSAINALIKEMQG